MLVATVSVLTGKSSDFLKIGVAAAGRGDLDTVSAVLAEKPEWLRRIGSHGRTMLWEAAYRGRGAMVDYLADRGADIDARGCHFTPLLVEVSPYCAARVKKHDAVAQGLLARGAKVDVRTAAYLGDVASVRDSLAADPDLVPMSTRRCCTTRWLRGISTSCAWSSPKAPIRGPTATG